MKYLQARYILPMQGPAITDGFVAIDSGRIVALGGAETIPQGAEVIDYGNAVILPGFVNAHTHLELSYLAGKVPPGDDFVDWLGRLMDQFVANPPTRELIRNSTRSGIAQSIAAGVTTVGDITRFPRWTRPELDASGMRALSFGEVIAIGRQRHRFGVLLRAAAERTYETDRLAIAVSPHAPYTVEPNALTLCAEAASELGKPMCIHAGETRDEEEFTQCGTGPFVEHLRRLNVWDDEIPVSGGSPIELLSRCHALAPQTILAHANYLSNSELSLIADSGAHVAYCPRTHHAFGHATHPWHRLQERGTNVCVGTDSLASNPDLSVLDELRHLAHHHVDTDPQALLCMGTLNGAAALGIASQVGSLQRGKDADLVIFQTDATAPDDVAAALLHSHESPQEVYLRGVPILSANQE